MDIQELQQELDQLNYCDKDILDFQIHYFGDEISMCIESSSNAFYWNVLFTSCLRVYYHTDADWRGPLSVRKMRKTQLGYVAQSITVSESSDSGFYKITMDLSIAEVIIECRNVTIERSERHPQKFFWETN